MNGTFWRIDKDTLYNNNFAFEVDVSSNSVENIVEGIQNYYSLFNKNEYVEKLVATRKESSNSLTIKEIVIDVDSIGQMLSTLASDILYKCRLVAEEKASILNTKNIKNNDDFDYEY